MRQADVAVVGAGVLGTFHAYFAARKGLQTLLLERNAWPDEASTRNFGMLPQTIVNPTSPWAAIARESAEIYRSLQEQHDISIRETGSLYLAATRRESRVLREFVELFGDRYSCRYFTAPETISHYPFVRRSYCRGSLLFPHDLSLDPRAMLRTLIPLLVEKGLIEYAPSSRITRAEVAGDHCVLTDAANNQYQAGRVIICSGAEWRALFPDVLRASGLHRCKLQMMQTVPQPGFRLPHSILSGLSIRRYPAFAACPSYERMLREPVDDELSAYGIHLLFKQAPDGAITIGDSHEYQTWDDTDSYEERTDCRINDAMLFYAWRMMRLPTWELRSLWNGYYTLLHDQPVYTATIEGCIHLVTGIGGKGMTTGPGFAARNIEAILA